MSTWTAIDARHMSRALRLGVKSLGATSPNPGVGCVIAKGPTVLGSGRHQQCGGPHGEINALSDCRQQGHTPTGATAYVTLAPCTRHGRTPPCCDALIAAGVSRVVAALSDPNQDEAGDILGRAGITYEVGLMGDLAAHLHGGFLTRVRQDRPRITLKWASTLDGSLASSTGHSGWISSPEALSLSRRRRRAFDAIAIGVGTLKADNPRLLSSDTERTPMRVIFDARPHINTYLDKAILKDLNRAPVHVIHSADSEAAFLNELDIKTTGIDNAQDPSGIASALRALGLGEVLIEGGSKVHGLWLRSGLVDRLEIYQGALTIGGGMPLASGAGVERVDLGLRWQPECPPRLLGSTVLTRWTRA